MLLHLRLLRKVICEVGIEKAGGMDLVWACKGREDLGIAALLSWLGNSIKVVVSSMKLRITQRVF